jgi:hypothetical protein
VQGPLRSDAKRWNEITAERYHITICHAMGGNMDLWRRKSTYMAMMRKKKVDTANRRIASIGAASDDRLDISIITTVRVFNDNY